MNYDQPFTVLYMNPASSNYHRFNCMAKNKAHAEDRCRQLYPHSWVIQTNKGHDNGSIGVSNDNSH